MDLRTLDLHSISRRTGRTTSQVEADAKFLAVLEQRPLYFYRHFFSKGDGWLYPNTETLPYEREGLQLIEPRQPTKNLWVWPRGHLKTTRKKTHYVRRALMGWRKYIVIFTATEKNQEGWAESLFDFFERDDLFPEAHYFFPYLFPNGKPLRGKRNTEEVSLTNDVTIAIRSFKGEARGLNRRGRPDEIELDDTMPSDAAESDTIRVKYQRRFFGVIRFLGGPQTQINASATIVAPGDQWHQIAAGKISGWRSQWLRACDEDFGNVLNPYLWSPERLRKDFKEFDDAGESHIWHREMRNDPREGVSKPLAALDYRTYNRPDWNAETLYRVISIDNAGGHGGDDWVCMETGHTPLIKHADGSQTSKVLLLDYEAINEFKPEDKYTIPLNFIRRRRPHRIRIQETSESRDYIDTLQTYLQNELAADGVFVEIERTKGTRNKNEYIKSYLYPILKQERFLLPEPVSERDRKLHDRFIRQAKNWDITKTEQPDDILECAASCVEGTRVADVHTALPPRPADPVMAEMYDQMYLHKTPDHKVKPRTFAIGV